ncbi:unnamed protein product [Blepharisma stoltei]|uniref:Cyclin-like domain-containing protein n=1 Tax=Blepharisma stoltei TaxID=1481888 RepID=A0AAU9IUG2_9CILI|nr:unnamed protein product [Blepharisma stoltei]
MNLNSSNKENYNPLTKSRSRRTRSLTHKPEKPAPLSEHLMLLKSFDVSYNLDEAFTHHYITERIRAKLVDWMIEVLHSFHSSSRTLFLAVKLLDIYIANSSGLVPLDLHVIGVASMFIASKYEDIKQLTLKNAHENIAHGKISKESILAMEKDILNIVNYNVFIPTLYDYLEYFIQNSIEEIAKYSWFLADLSLLKNDLSSASMPKLAEAIVLKARKDQLGIDETPTQGPVALYVQELDTQCELYRFEYQNFTSILMKHSVFDN